MTLWLANRTSSRVAAAITFADRSLCGGEGGDYHVRGWWNIDPGVRIQVDSRDLADVGRFWYSHGHSVTGETAPSGFQYACPPQRFDRCWLIWSSDGIPRFFKEHVVTGDDLTIDFTQAG
ncbi:DUF1036 domain-containing protein [Nonomuraea fuscirosea]|uniref:DUF1036 domain-containing protein n=1 Tax=Nonomuraea fuscirosea TaxID=1291556 RepID=UPI00343042E7